MELIESRHGPTLLLALSSVAKRIEFGARTESLPKPSLAVLMLENEFRRAKAALAALDA